MKMYKLLLFQLIIFASILVTLGSCVKYYSREAKVDLNKYKTIYIGWVDLHEEDWEQYFYESQEAWNKTINMLNSGFQVRLKNEFLTDKIIKAASNSKSEPDVKDGLYIKFSNVKIDKNQYSLYMELTFIDLETHSKIYEIPESRFYGSLNGFENMLYYALEDAQKLIYREIYQKDNRGFLNIILFLP